ncbi:MAG: sulfotransferase family protein [Solirubrobacteraceae bacterium]
MNGNRVQAADPAPNREPSNERAPAAANERGGRFPDFYIVGHGKCGTTALYRMLLAHPRLHMPVKEPRFFAPDRRTRYWRPASSRRKHPESVEGYLALFAQARPDQLIGEASPTYLRSSLAARNIAAVQPKAKIIAILREPASLLRSVHLQAVRNYDETQKDFRKALELEDARRQGKRIPRFSQFPAVLLYSELIRFVEQLRRYHDVFPAEQVLVLIYEDFRADNQGTVHQVLRFLDLDENIAIPSVELESLRTPRYVLLDQLMRGSTMVRRSGAVRPLARALGARVPRALSQSSTLAAVSQRLRYVESPKLDEELMLELRRRFKPEVEAVSDYLGRDLVTLWGYDRLS